MSDEMVYITSTKGYTPRYHTYRDCQALLQVPDDEIREESRATLEGHRELCKCCDGPINVSTPNPHERTQALAKMDPEDLGLSPLGERPRPRGETRE